MEQTSKQSTILETLHSPFGAPTHHGTSGVSINYPTAARESKAFWNNSVLSENDVLSYSQRLLRAAESDVQLLAECTTNRAFEACVRSSGRNVLHERICDVQIRLQSIWHRRTKWNIRNYVSCFRTSIGCSRYSQTGWTRWCIRKFNHSTFFV